MVTLCDSAIRALERLGDLEPGPAQRNAIRAKKEARRKIRHEAFLASIRTGLQYSKQCVRRTMKPKGHGGARLEFQLRRIIP